MTVDARGPERVDLDAVARECRAFVRDVVADADAVGVVVVLRGDIDSTVAATLAVDALGPERVRGLVLPTDATPPGTVADATAIADVLSIERREVDVGPLVERLKRSVAVDVRTTRADPLSSRTTTVIADRDPTRENYAAAIDDAAERLRATVAAFEATTSGRLVLGSATRTERLLGRTVEHGADLLPIGHRFGSTVRDLARHVGVPDGVVGNPAPDGEFDAPPETIDAILHAFVDEGIGVDAISDALAVDRDVVARVAATYTDARDRVPPPTPEAYRS